MKVVFAIVLAACVLASVSCDPPAGEVQPLHVNPTVRLDPLAQLAANRNTHVAADQRENVYWSQETENGQDVVFVMGPGGDLPSATTLTSRNILALLEPIPPDDPNRRPGQAGQTRPAQQPPQRASGNITSLVSGADGSLYFYFTGGTGRVGRAALGQYEPRTQRIRILADTQRLMNVSEMGRSLDLARGKLIVNGAIIHLWLRHTDSSVLLDFDVRRLPVTGPAPLSQRIGVVRQDEVRLDLTRDQVNLFAGPVLPGDPLSTTGDDRRGLLLTDLRVGVMYLVDHEGQSRVLASMVGLPQAYSDPIVLPPREPGEQQRIVFFGSDGNMIDPSVMGRPESTRLETHWPALVTLTYPKAEYSAIGRDALQAPGEFAMYAVRIRQLIPYGRQTYVGYDSSSGQLLRIRVNEGR